MSTQEAAPRALRMFDMILFSVCAILLLSQVTLTARSDRFTTRKWEGLLGSRDLQALRPADFEMVDAGARIPLTLDCVRNP